MLIEETLLLLLIMKIFIFVFLVLRNSASDDVLIVLGWMIIFPGASNSGRVLSLQTNCELKEDFQDNTVNDKYFQKQKSEKD